MVAKLHGYARRFRVKRAEALARLQATIASGRAVIGAGAGTGLSAKCAEAGGVDLIIIYNSGRYRMAGRGSLSGLMPYGDANAIVVDMAREVLPVVKDVPVLAGVCGTDPFRLMDVFMDELSASASRACRTSRPSGCSTASSASISKRRAWATTSRSTPSASRARRTCSRRRTCSTSRAPWP